MRRAMLLLSGGMDSATLLYLLRSQGMEVDTLSVHYGQRHERELAAAVAVGQAAGVRRHDLLDLRSLGLLLQASVLTDASRPVPTGHYAEETMRQTVVPGRNAILLAIAWGIAASRGIDTVATAVHAGDHHIYPDCRPDFIREMNQALFLGTRGHAADRVHLFTPFLHNTKAEIARIGLDLKVPYELTWTCYVGGEAPCGECGACNERHEAFKLNHVTDPQLTRGSAG